MSLKSARETLGISRSGQYRKESQRQDSDRDGGEAKRASAIASLLGIQADDGLVESSGGSCS